MKNLCLDIGNVLCKVDFSEFIVVLSTRLNLTTDECWYFLNRVQKLHDLGLTSLSDELRDHFKIKSEAIIQELNEAWDRVIIPNYSLINSLNEFIEKNKIEVILVSNIGYEHAKLFDQKVNFNIALRHFSCYVGARKPNLVYYQSLLMKYPQFNGAVYVDDNKDNLAMGKENGLVPVHFDLSTVKNENLDILLISSIYKEMMR